MRSRNQSSASSMSYSVLPLVGRSALPARYAVVYTSALRDAVLKTADGLGLKLAAIHGHDDARTARSLPAAYRPSTRRK
jgi:hypothetical protein